MPKERKSKRKEFVIRIGPELMEIIEEQIEKIREVTYGVANDSKWEAGEIIAKKFKNKV
jgi:hypothetical protein